jgi:hypothetical protein
VRGGRAVKKAYKNEPVDLVDLARQSQGFVLDGFTFDGCTLLGPAVLMPAGPDLTFVRNDLTFQGFWEIEVPRAYVGGIGIARCEFTGCDFSQVGLAGNRDFLDQFFDESGSGTIMSE